MTEQTPLPVGDPRHGTHSAYTNHGCRCTDCRQATAEYHRAGRRRRGLLLQAGEVPVTHGRYATYVNYQCRCAECRAANTQHAREYRKASA